MLRIALFLAAGGFLFGLCMSPAHAQGWLTDRDGAQGPGFRVGNFEIHPGLGIEGGYDSNLFFEDSDVDEAGLLRITGHVYLSTLGQQRSEEGETDGESAPRLRFNAGASASYYSFFTDRVGGNVSVDGFFDLTVNPEGTYVFRLYNDLSRTIRPFTDAPSEGEAPSYGRVRNQAGADITAQSRGRTLSATLGYRFDFDFFEDGNFDQFNNFDHLLSLDFNWRFFPNTALVSRTKANFQNYYNQFPTEPGSLVVDNQRVSQSVGINGAFTHKIGFTALVGYAAGFYGDSITDDFDSLTALLELQYRPRRTLDFALGYDRGVRPSFIGNFVTSNRIYVKGRVLVGGSLLLGANLAVSFDESGLALDPSGDVLGNSSRRNDTRIFATLFSEYRFTNWLALNATLGYSGDFTDYEFLDPGAGSAFPDAPAGFNKFDAFLGLRVFY